MVIIGIERKCLWTGNHNKGKVSGDWSVRTRHLIIAAAWQLPQHTRGTYYVPGIILRASPE